jgi:hypothetical protein
MADHHCANPGCTESNETTTMYREPTGHGESFTVCGRHADFDKDGLEVIVEDAASEASAEILNALQ